MGRKKKIQTELPAEQQETNQNQEVTNQNPENGIFSKNIEDIKTDFIEEQQEELQEKKQRKKRTSKKADAEEEQKKLEFSESIKGVGGMIIDLIVSRLPNPIPLSDMEKNSFDNLFNKVAFKYSNLLGTYQEESALLIITGMILIPRIQVKKDKQDKNFVE